MMAVKTSCGKGRFSNFSIAKLLEKGSKDEEGEQKEELEEGGADDEDCEIKQEKIELLGGQSCQDRITKTKPLSSNLKVSEYIVVRISAN